MRIQYWTLLTCLLASSLLASGSMAIVAANDSTLGPNWEECLNDPDPDCEAGNTIGTAEKVSGSGYGEIIQISGSTKGEASFLPGIPGDWQDIYTIFISKPINFEASTLVNSGGFADFDSMLWLFSESGKALLANNDAGVGETGSILLNESSNGAISLQDIGPGIYYIAISGFNSTPITNNMEDMFPIPLPPGQVSAPTQEGLTKQLGGWLPEATPMEYGDYVIRFRADSIRTIPYSCGEEDSGGCFTANGTPGCDRLQCCTKVCFEDPYCCDVQWDQQCANQAVEKCRSCGNPDAGGMRLRSSNPLLQ